VRILKLKAFARWARKEGLADRSLLVAIREMRGGLIEADLGGGLFKKRGAYRTILAADLRGRWVFLYGFAKSERDDLDDAELRDWKRVANSYLALSDDMLKAFIDARRLIEVKNGEPAGS
jgi:hypothetical protein